MYNFKDDDSNNFCLFRDISDINSKISNEDLFKVEQNYNCFGWNINYHNQFDIEENLFKKGNLNENHNGSFKNLYENLCFKKKTVFKIYKIPSIHTYDYSKKSVLKLYKNEEVKRLNNLLENYHIIKKHNRKFDFPYYYVRNNSVKNLKFFFFMTLKNILVNGHKNENKGKRNNRLIKKLQKVCPNEITYINQPIYERLRMYLISEKMKKEVIEMNKTLKNKIDLTRINQDENLVDFVLNHH